jgi:hypothetical protein
MFIVQLAAALGIFSILMGFGAEKAIQYAQSRLPYSTAQRVVQATNFVGNAANSYYNQYCSSGTCSTTGLNYPRVQDLVSAGYLPSGQGYSSCNCYTTKDGSVIKLNAGSGPSGTYGMTITPGAMLASKPAYASMVASRIPGSVLSGNTINVSQPVPALANIGSSLAGKYIQNDPSTPQNGGINITQGVTTQGPINTNGQPITAGQLNTPYRMISPSGIEYVYVRPGYTNTFGWYEVGSSSDSSFYYPNGAIASFPVMESYYCYRVSYGGPVCKGNYTSVLF